MRQQMAASDNQSNASNMSNGVNNQTVSEFKFPMRKEQLCDEPTDPNRFWVKTRKNLSNWNEEQLLREI